MLHYCEQHSDEWFQLRAGKITASEIHKCITPTGKVSDSQTARDYIETVVWEMLAGMPAPGVRQNDAMRWGTENEPHARAIYENLTENAVEQAGLFVCDDEPLFAFSPDGLVGNEGGIQIKCPHTPGPHFEVARSIFARNPSVPAKNLIQVQFELGVSGADWWDFVSYDPRLGSLDLAFLVVHVERDGFTDKVMAAAADVRDRVMESFLELDQLRKKG